MPDQSPSPVNQRRRQLVRDLPMLAVAASLTSLHSNSASAAPMNAIEQSLENSRTNKRGVTVYVGSASVAMVVTEIADGFVIGRSQQYDRIVVRLDRIDAAMG